MCFCSDESKVWVVHTNGAQECVSVMQPGEAVPLEVASTSTSALPLAADKDKASLPSGAISSKTSATVSMKQKTEAKTTPPKKQKKKGKRKA